MKAYVTLKIDGRYVAEIEHDNMNVEQLKQLAIDAYIDEDFGPLEAIESDVIIIEDENGNYIYEK